MVFETPNIYHCRLERWNSVLRGLRLLVGFSSSEPPKASTLQGTMLTTLITFQIKDIHKQFFSLPTYCAHPNSERTLQQRKSLHWNPNLARFETESQTVKSNLCSCIIDSNPLVLRRN